MAPFTEQRMLSARQEES